MYFEVYRVIFKGFGKQSFPNTQEIFDFRWFRKSKISGTPEKFKIFRWVSEKEGLQSSKELFLFFIYNLF